MPDINFSFLRSITLLIYSNAISMKFLKTDARPSTYKGIYQTLWDDIIKKKHSNFKNI